MEFGKLLSRAWQITWQHKILWLFGILAAFGSGNSWSGSNRQSGQNPIVLPPDLQQQLNRPEVMATILIGGFVLLVIVLLLFVLSIIARGGLIGGIRIADEQGRVTFRDAWAIGLRYFWRMLGIALVLIAPALVVGLFTAFAALVTSGTGLIGLLPLLGILGIAYIPFVIVAHFAQFAVVLDNLGVMDAFRRGWELLKANLLNIIVLGLMLIVIGFIAGFMLAAPFIVAAIPAMLAFYRAGPAPNISLLLIAGLVFVCYLPIALVLGGMLHTWTTAVWTLAYQQFSRHVPVLSTPTPPPPVPAV